MLARIRRLQRDGALGHPGQLEDPEAFERLMPTKEPAEPYHAERVEELLHDAGAKHTRARKYGSSVIVESGLRPGSRQTLPAPP